MALRWPAVACALLLAAGCRSSSPTGAAPAATTTTAAAVAAADRLPGGYQPATTVGTLSDPDIGESSGLVASRQTPGHLWTHNDSGDGPFVYCLDARIRSCGVWRLTGAEAFDWEDIAIGPGPRAGEPYLYVGDIGDNIDQRTEIVVYRVLEPVTGPGGAVPAKASPAPTERAEVLRLRYPDGPHDAEALLVHPTTGDLYVLSKDASGPTVYKAADPIDAASVTTLRAVGVVRLSGGMLGQITAGDISPDGRRVALATYSSGYELALPEKGEGFDAIWAERPAPVALGPRLQGESIAYRLDSRALLTTSEMVPSPVFQVERGR